MWAHKPKNKLVYYKEMNEPLKITYGALCFI